MDQSDFQRFSDVLAGVLDVYGKERSATAVAIWWKVLQNYSLDQVENALAVHVKTNKFAPTPADVSNLIVNADGRPGADEAWAMIPRSESASVIWTEEMAHAYGVAAPLLENGDAVAARKTFIQAYEKAVEQARLSGTPIKVTPSWGWDASTRESAIAQAVERGLLTLEKAKPYIAQLPSPETSALAMKITNGLLKITT